MQANENMKCYENNATMKCYENNASQSNWSKG